LQIEERLDVCKIRKKRIVWEEVEILQKILNRAGLKGKGITIALICISIQQRAQYSAQNGLNL